MLHFQGRPEWMSEKEWQRLLLIAANEDRGAYGSGEDMSALAVRFLRETVESAEAQYRIVRTAQKAAAAREVLYRGALEMLIEWKDSGPPESRVSDLETAIRLAREALSPPVSQGVVL